MAIKEGGLCDRTPDGPTADDVIVAIDGKVLLGVPREVVSYALDRHPLSFPYKKSIERCGSDHFVSHLPSALPQPSPLRVPRSR